MQHVDSSFAETARQMAVVLARREWGPDDDRVSDAGSVAYELALEAPEGVPAGRVANFAILRVRDNRQFPCCSRSVGQGRRNSRNTTKVVAFDIRSISRENGNPASIAAFRIDFLAWFARLPETHQFLVEQLVAGATTGELAEKLFVTPSAISQRRRWLWKSWKAYYDC